MQDEALRNHYRTYCARVALPAGNRYEEAIRYELDLSLGRMLSQKPEYQNGISQEGIEFRLGAGHGLLRQRLDELTPEGYRIRQVSDGNRRLVVVQSAGDAGLLYGMFHLIRLMQCGERFDDLDITEVPQIEMRLLNHWDNLDGYIERGYGGGSLWNWDELPEKISQRYIDYARANASLGINGTVIHNVNADPRILRADYLEKVKALADVFRKYNIKMYLSANFAAPLKPSKTPELFKKWGGIARHGRSARS